MTPTPTEEDRSFAEGLLILLDYCVSEQAMKVASGAAWGFV